MTFTGRDAVPGRIDMTSDLRTIGARLLAARRWRKLRRTTFAEQLAVPTAQVRDWEGDDAIPGDDDLARAAAVLDVPASWLATGDLEELGCVRRAGPVPVPASLTASLADFECAPRLPGLPGGRVAAWVARRDGAEARRTWPEIAAGSTVGARLKRARAAAALSQADVALALGAGVARVSMWETGRADPGPFQTARLARLFGIPSALLARGEDGGDEE